MKISIKLIMALFLCVFICKADANELIITKSFTGGWYDPSKNGQEFLLEIISSNNLKKALTTWFTFDNDEQQYWLISVGQITGQSIEFPMMLTQGGQFGDNHDPSLITNTYWGDVTFTFDSCNTDSVSWSPCNPPILN